MMSPRRVLRRFRVHPGIRLRLAVWYTLVLAIVLIFFSAVTYFSLSQSLYAELDRNLVAESDLVAEAIRISRNLTLPGNTINQLPADTAVSVFGRTGSSIVRLSGSDLLQPSESMVASAEKEQPIYATDLINGQNWRVYARPLIRNGQITGVIEVGQPVIEIQRALFQRLESMLIAVPLTLLLATGGGIFLSSRAMGPIERIVETAETIQAEDLSRRIDEPKSQDEVGRLAHTFNAMLDRIESAFQRERQFTADAAHELRTPLTLVKNQIEVALSRPRTPAEYEQVLVSVEDDIARLSKLVRNLLHLARTDQPIVKKPVDLVAVAADVVEQFEPLAVERGLSLRLEPSEPVVVLGDASQLGIVAANLIDNALSYAGLGGCVTVDVTRVDGSVTLTVRDDGPGISTSDLPHVFDRFYRVDPARQAGHHGLGLALCTAIASEHNGRMTVASQLGQGSSFSLHLPVQPPTSSARHPVRPAQSESGAPAVPSAYDTRTNSDRSPASTR
jgi:heavy metal sensor kinase